MDTTLQTLGGLGLFLLGMIIMTEALRALAGKMIHQALMRFTHNPLSGAVTGAMSTAILQSSSATTVAAVGFVGAGLITFPQSLGIIFGANIGTTMTGWLVALIGFKLQLGTLMLPIIFIGVALRLFANGRIAHVGLALAGFGLIFVGISTLQQGMVGLQDVVTPAIFPADTFVGRLKLLGIGILITIITQSSSAGVAAALTALFTGTINFEQAAALVIGMDVGTTVTAAMATIGGSVSARRTGFSHVIYNLLTGMGALIFLTPYTLIWEAWAPGELINNAEVALVAFHSSFNILGVIIILPFTSHFARLIQRVIPDQADAYTQNLDDKLVSEPTLALAATQASIHSEFNALLRHIIGMLDDARKNQQVNLKDLQNALDETHSYVDQIHLDKSNEADWKVLVSIIHSLDHLQRLHERCEEDCDRAIEAKQTHALKSYVNRFKTKVGHIIENIEINDWPQAENNATDIASLMSNEAKDMRHKIMVDIAEGVLDVPTGTDSLEAVRWLRRVSAHILRITHHQNETQRNLRKLG